MLSGEFIFLIYIYHFIIKHWDLPEILQSPTLHNDKIISRLIFHLKYNWKFHFSYTLFLRCFRNKTRKISFSLTFLIYYSKNPKQMIIFIFYLIFQERFFAEKRLKFQNFPVNSVNELINHVCHFFLICWLIS